MRFDVITLFPDAFPGPLAVGVVGRSLTAGRIEVVAHDLREWGLGSRRQVDDVPFGGGPGMVLRPEPLFAAIRHVSALPDLPPARRILLSAPGQPLTQKLVADLASSPRLLLVCGRYEGVDERVTEGLALEEVSVGDFVLAGGELAAMVLIEGVARLLPGTLGDPSSAYEESFADGRAEYPHYTRPAEFEGMAVPSVLRSGDHAKIVAWRRAAALERAQRLRPRPVTEPGQTEQGLDPTTGAAIASPQGGRR